MTIATALAGCHTIFLDTSPMIYYVEAHSQFGPLAKEVVNAFQAGQVMAYSSVVTLVEVLPKPVETGNTELVEQFTRFLKQNKHLRLIGISEEIAEHAGQLRGRYPTLRTMDALQLAAAMHIGADAFITNDTRLRGVTDIQLIVLKDYLS